MSTSPTQFLHVGVALLLAGALFLSANTRSLASKQNTTLPTLRLDYQVVDAREPRPAGLGPPYSLAISLDPPFSHNLADWETNALTNANLVQVLPNDRVAPDLATWTISKNALVYTFTIRSNARFSNGHDVTAADAAFSIERALSPDTPDSNYVGVQAMSLIRGYADFLAGKTKALPGIRVVSKRVLRITLVRPAAYFLATLTLGDVLDRTVVAGKPLGTPRLGRHDGYLTTTCSANQGAGPFKFVCRNSSSTPSSFYPPGHTPTYTFVPNPYYYGPKSHIRVELPALTNDYKSYLSDKLETSTVPAVYLRRWKGKSNEYHEFPWSGVNYFTPNVHLAPFDNVHCRLAVAYALDRDTLANNILGGTQRATYAIVPKGMLGYYDGKDNPHYNPSRARTELAQCPSRTVPFELVYATGNDNLSAAIGNMLAAVGMNAKLKVVSVDQWNTILSQPLDKTKTQIVYYGWVQDYPDPQDYCSLLLRSGQPSAIGGWHNATYDRLVDRAEVVVDPRKRAQLYIQAQHLALSQGVLIPMFESTKSYLIKPYVRGLVAGPPTINLVAKNAEWSNVSVSKH